MVMQNPITLFTGQWADLSVDDMARFAREKGKYDGLEMACWGEHIDVQKAVGDDGEKYLGEVLDTLFKYKIGVWSFGAHLVGQALAVTMVDDDLLGILPQHVWSAEPERLREKAAAEMMDTARAAERFRDLAKQKFGEEGERLYNVHVITGFTGSPIWHKVYKFPPESIDRAERGFQLVADVMDPILDVFEQTGVKFGLEVHPTEIAFDTVTAARLINLINRASFGVNYDPSHFGYQGVDYIGFIDELAPHVHHAHMKDVAWQLGKGRSGVFGGHLDFGNDERYWDFKSIGRGMIDFDKILASLDKAGYNQAHQPLSVEWEDALLKREAGAIASQLVLRGKLTGDTRMVAQGLEMYKDANNYQSAAAFDKAFQKK